MSKQYKKPAKTYPHSFTRKVCHWLYCAHCGMVLLKNDVSLKLSQQPCKWAEEK